MLSWQSIVDLKTGLRIISCCIHFYRWSALSVTMLEKVESDGFEEVTTVLIN